MAKNGQKWPKWPKNGLTIKNDKKVQKNGQKRSKTVKNGQKWPKIDKLTTFTLQNTTK